LIQDAEGTIWLGTEKGLFRSSENGGELAFSSVDIGLRANESKYVYELYEDRRGAVWVGTANSLARISGDNRVTVFHNEDDAVFFQEMLEDGAGNFWVGSYKKGLFKFTVDENDAPKIVKQFAAAPNSELEDVDAIEESSGGKLWIGGSNGLYEFEPAANKLLRYTRTSGLNYYRFQTLFEDRAGNLWLGFSVQGFGRIRSGRFEFFGDEQNVPTGGVSNLFFDRENRLWIALRQGGVLRIDDAEADTLDFVNYTEANGLSSNRTLSLTQDRQGFIYVGTDREYKSPESADARNQTAQTSRQSTSARISLGGLRRGRHALVRHDGRFSQIRSDI